MNLISILTVIRRGDNVGAYYARPSPQLEGDSLDAHGTYLASDMIENCHAATNEITNESEEKRINRNGRRTLY